MSQKCCCVPVCHTSFGDGIPMYRFPNPSKKMDLFITWLEKIGGHLDKLDADYVYKNRRVCRRHFDQVYVYTKRLCALAVPSLCLTGAYALLLRGLVYDGISDNYNKLWSFINPLMYVF